MDLKMPEVDQKSSPKEILDAILGHYEAIEENLLNERKGTKESIRTMGDLHPDDMVWNYKATLESKLELLDIIDTFYKHARIISIILQAHDKIEEIRKKAMAKEATGVLQDSLMKIGFTLEEADVVITHWYKDKPEEWFDDDGCPPGKSIRK